MNYCKHLEQKCLLYKLKKEFLVGKLRVQENDREYLDLKKEIVVLDIYFNAFVEDYILCLKRNKIMF
jgi:hypothetical protein